MIKIACVVIMAVLASSGSARAQDAQAAAVLSGLVSARMPERPNECAELLLALSENL